jgi:hypothetical protein
VSPPLLRLVDPQDTMTTDLSIPNPTLPNSNPADRESPVGSPNRAANGEVLLDMANIFALGPFGAPVTTEAIEFQLFVREIGVGKYHLELWIETDYGPFDIATFQKTVDASYTRSATPKNLFFYPKIKSLALRTWNGTKFVDNVSITGGWSIDLLGVTLDGQPVDDVPGYALTNNIDAIKVDATGQTREFGFSVIVRPDGTNAAFPKQRTFVIDPVIIIAPKRP